MDYFAAGVGRGSTWHGRALSDIRDIDIDSYTLIELVETAGLDYPVFKVPMHAGPLPDGSYVVDPSQHALVRGPAAWDPNSMLLKPVDARFEILQNTDIAALLQPIADDMPLEFMAAVKGGSIVFFEFAMAPFYVNNHPDEEHRPYLLFVNDLRDKTGGYRWGYTTVRTVCYNTVTAALRVSKDMARITHTADSSALLEYRVAVEEAAIKFSKSVQETLDQLFAAPAAPEAVDGLAFELFPKPKVPAAIRRVDKLNDLNLSDESKRVLLEKADRASVSYQNAVARNADRRDEFGTRFAAFCGRHTYAADTKYALWQTATETVNHSDTFRGTGVQDLGGLFFGERARLQRVAWAYVTKED